MSNGLAGIEKTLVEAALAEPLLLARSGLTAEMFSDYRYSKAWGTMLALESTDAPITPAVVQHKLGDTPLPLVEQPLEHSRWGYFIDTVRNAWAERVARGQLEQLLNSRKHYGLRFVEECSNMANDVLRRSWQHSHSLSDGVRSLYDTLGSPVPENHRYGLDSGLGIEQCVAGGIPVDKLSLFFARTGNCKTTVAFNLLLNLALDGNRVVYVTTEDSRELVEQVFLSMISGVPVENIAMLSLDALQLSAVNNIRDKALHAADKICVIDETPESMNDVVRAVRSLDRDERVSAVVVDYLQDFRLGNQQERVALAENAKIAFDAAKRDRIAYVALSQVLESKMVSRGSWAPLLDDVFGSSGIKQKCKLGIGVRVPHTDTPVPNEEDDYYDIWRRNEKEYESLIELWIRKARFARVNQKILLSCDFTTGRMTPCEETSREVVF